jgi:hypothetical protein
VYDAGEQNNRYYIAMGSSTGPRRRTC